MFEWLPILYQIIQVNATTPCFMNNTAGFQIFQNCGMQKDWLQAILLPWQWITGGYFTLVIVVILSLFTYIKYHKAIYPVLIGVIFLPISYFTIPTPFLVFSMVLTALMIAGFIVFTFVSQTNEQ